MTTSEANARQQGRSQKARNGSQFLATRLTAATSLQTPDNKGTQSAHPAAAPDTSDPSNPRAGMRHPHRHAARPLGHAPSVPVRATPSRVVTTQTGHTPHSPRLALPAPPGSRSPLPQARAPRSPGLAGSSPPGSCAPVGYGKAGQTLTGSGPPVASSA